MLVLDTDHIVEYQKGTSAEAQRLTHRLQRAAEPFATTIVTVEETMRGWLADIRRTSDPFLQVPIYHRLGGLFQFFATWDVLRWDAPAATQFAALRQAKIRIGSMDLKIASICISHSATLLTRNKIDFDKVPGLTCDDWLVP